MRRFLSQPRPSWPTPNRPDPDGVALGEGNDATDEEVRDPRAARAGLQAGT
jgi:hypothetical protein